MARRYVVCPITGDGSDESPYCAAVADTVPAHVATIPSDLMTGKPKHEFTFAQAAASNAGALANLDSQPGHIALPAFSLNTPLGGVLPMAARQNLQARLRDRGIDVPAITATMPLRDVVRACGLALSPTYDERREWVRDPEQPTMPRVSGGSNGGSVFVEDSFTDTDSTALSSHAGETGATWTQHPSSATTLLITNNRVRANSSTGSRYFASGLPALAEYDVAANVTRLTQDLAAGLLGRLDVSAHTGYRGQLLGIAGVVTDLRLDKMMTGTVTMLGEVRPGDIAGTGLLELMLRDGSKVARADFGAVVDVSSSDNDVAAAGRVGVFSVSLSTSGYHLDNILATNVGNGNGNGTLSGRCVGRPEQAGQPSWVGAERAGGCS